MLSPIEVAPRRRLREKSPDPHRHAVDWHAELGFACSPALQDGSQRGKRLQDKSPTTPGGTKRLRSKTPEWQVLLEQPPAKAKPGVSSTDPKEALLLLSRRELVEMCMECGVEQKGYIAKAVLIERLVGAHREGRAPSPLREALAVPARSEAASSAQVNAPALRVSVVPPPPSSWGAPPLPSSWTLGQVSESLPHPKVSLPANCARSEITEPVLVPEVSLLGKVAQPEVIRSPVRASQARISSSPTPARSPYSPAPASTCSPVQPSTEALATIEAPEAGAPTSTSSPVQPFTEAPATMEVVKDVAAAGGSPQLCETSKACASSSNDWWRNVALRWPKIVANLKAAATPPNDAPSLSPMASGASPGKRVLSSPSILDSLQAPQRHSSASCGSSPTMQVLGNLP